MNMYLKDQQKRQEWIMAKGNTHWQRPKNKTTKQNAYIKQQNQTVCYCNKGQGKCVDEYMYIFQFFSQLHVMLSTFFCRYLTVVTPSIVLSHCPLLIDLSSFAKSVPLLTIFVGMVECLFYILSVFHGSVWAA